MVTLSFTYPGFKEGETATLLDGIFIEGKTSSVYTNFLKIDYDNQISESVLQGKNREWSMLLTASQQQQQANESTPVKPIAVTTHVSWQSFLLLGMKHILTGYDHLLFLFALLLRKQTLKQYAAMITAFTLAHSVTLTLSVLGIVDLPSHIVEPLIALSICYVAIENIFRKKVSYRWALTFFFGLIHGLGFASILKEMAIPKSALAASLISFNVGIEIVQLGLILLVLPVLTWFQRQPSYKRGMITGSAVIFVLGAFWLVQRV